MEKNLRILVIDDDEFDRKNAERSLRSFRPLPVITFASSATEGLELIASSNFDCIFLDYLLPGMDGLQILARIREGGNQTPVIVMTSQGSEEIAVNMMRAGASHYMTKEMLKGESVEGTLLSVLRLHDAEVRKAIAERELQEKIAQLNLILHATPVIHFTLGKAGELTLIEGAGIDNLGIHAATLTGKEITAIFPGQKDLKRDVILALEGENILREISHKGKYYELHLHAFRDVHGLTGVLGLIIDISERKEFELALKRAKELADQTASFREEFLANMSHEIRTPMNAIMGYVHILGKSNHDPSLTEFIRVISNAGETLLSIINDILDLSKAESGRFVFSSIPFSIRDTIGQVFLMFQTRAAEKGLNFQIKMEENTPDLVTGDPNRLKQILINLTGNAMKFTPAGSVIIGAVCQKNSSDDCLIRFTVSDTGIGIPASKQAGVWDRYSQAGAGNSGNHGGSGLGLTISRKLVELQGGKIWLRSAEGKGSTFSFEIAFRKSQDDELLPPAKEFMPELPAGANVKILLAEDDEANRKLAELILEGFGCKVVSVENGEMAIRALTESDFDIILMDVQMPGVNGIEACRRIRNDFPTPKNQVPVIALTAHALETERQMCYEAGMNDFLLKPFSPDELYRKIILLTKRDALAERKEFNFEKPARKRPVLDLNYVKGIAGGNEKFLSEVIEIFIARVPEAMQKMRKNAKSGDWKATYQVLHGIKPSLVMFGGKKVEKLVSGTIDYLNGPNVDSKKVANRIKDLEKISESLIFEARKLFLNLRSSGNSRT